jgi:glycosyltransferase involved in cell wall biosynthesis
MTVYNSDKFLATALKSLSDQTFSNFELVVIEHGSSDKSLNIIDDWADERLKLEVLAKNIGRTPALNRCLDRAVGEYIAILDSDDVSAPDRLMQQVYFLDTHPDVGLVGSWSSYIDEFGNKIREHRPATDHKDLVKTVAIKNPLTHSSLMYRRDLAIRVNGYDDCYKYAQDYALIVDFAEFTNIAALPELLCDWRETKTSITNNSSIPVNHIFEELLVLKKAKKQLDLGFLNKVRNSVRQIVLRAIIVARLLRQHHFESAILSIVSVRSGRQRYLHG